MMYELVWVGENTYYIEAPAKVGVYDQGDGKVCLIDSGSDKDAAKKILRILDEKDWKLDRILCTHSHADHIGGNHYLQEKTGCHIYAAGVDRAIAEHPILEPTMLFGACPPKSLRNKYLMAKESVVEPMTEEALPTGLTMLRLDGHAMAMTAFHTDDDIWFVADALISEDVLKKHPVSYLFDVESYLNSLESLSQLQGRLFIPSHADPMEDIVPLVQLNREKALELMELIVALCRVGMDVDGLLGKVFDHYKISLDLSQYVLSGSTIRSYLSYLFDQGRLRVDISDNRLFWKSIPNT